MFVRACVYTLSCLEAMRIRRIVYCPVLPYFSTLLINGTVFGKKKVIERKICVLIFCKTFVRNVSHSENNSEIYHKCTFFGLHVKYRLFLSDFNEP